MGAAVPPQALHRHQPLPGQDSRSPELVGPGRLGAAVPHKRSIGTVVLCCVVLCCVVLCCVVSCFVVLCCVMLCCVVLCCVLLCCVVLCCVVFASCHCFRVQNATSCRREVRVIPWVLTFVPPVFCITLAVLTQQPLIAMAVSLWLANVFIYVNPVAALSHTFTTYIAGGIAEDNHAELLVFTFMISGLIGILARSGGIFGLTDAISRLATSSTRLQLCLWVAGISIFFSDYGSCLLVGSTMRAMADRMHVSREKVLVLCHAKEQKTTCTPAEGGGVSAERRRVLQPPPRTAGQSGIRACGARSPNNTIDPMPGTAAHR